MKIIINTSNLYVGGGLQVALSFINELQYCNNENDYYIFMSQAIKNQINIEEYPSNLSFLLIENSPSKLTQRHKIIRLLNKHESNINPDVVFTIFGPSYWKPNAIHLMGFADGWLYNPDSIAYTRLSIYNRIKRKLLSEYKKYYLKRDANYFVLETEDAKKKFSDILNVNNNNIFVVGNTYSSIFNDKKYIDTNNKHFISLPEKKENEFRLMYIAHNHPNKNLIIINKLLPLLKNMNINIKFILTINSESYDIMFMDSSNIINIGPIDQKSCPSIYKQCDAIFTPTLLETFSAAYPEAMKMQKPILTSNYSFVRDICQDAALYFDPLDPKDIVDKIKYLVQDKNLQNRLIKKGNKRILEFETAQSRAKKYIELCRYIINKGNK